MKGIELDETQFELAKKFLFEEMQNATIHFGEGRMNPSTIACILTRVEERLTGKVPELPDVKWGYDYVLKAMGWRKYSLEDPNNDTL